MPDPYQAHQTATGFGVFFQDDEDPFEVFHAEEVAEHFARMMNIAAADCRQHTEDRPKQRA